MTIKGKVLALVSIPRAELVVIAAGNAGVMRGVSHVVKATVGQRLMPIITDDVPRMNGLSDGIGYLLNADRDAYQGYLAEVQAIEAEEEERVVALIATQGTESGQVAERVGLAAAQFDEQGRQSQAVFQRQFDEWNRASGAAMGTSLALAKELARRAAIIQDCLKRFGEVRSQLDGVVGLIEKEMESLEGEASRAKQVEWYGALELLLNADRDAYQALVALMDYVEETDRAQFEAKVKVHGQELSQVRERTEKASTVFNKEMKAEYRRFLELLAGWEGQTREVAQITEANLDRMGARQKEALKSQAARAGDAGKGFAVVAEEVRNLARRSAEAAKDTAMMIENSVANARNSVGISDEVGRSLAAIATGIGDVAGRVEEIAMASTQQAQGIDQINSAVAQLDQVTQTNAANAEESASASEELNAQATELNGIVAQLVKLVEGGARAGGTGAAAAGAKGAGSGRVQRVAASDAKRLTAGGA